MTEIPDHYYLFDRAPHTEEVRKEALVHWKERIEKHRKVGGCSGCLAEAEGEFTRWKTLEVKT